MMSSRGLWLYLASSTLFLIVVPRPFLGLLIVQLIVVLALSSVRSVLIHGACVLALNACLKFCMKKNRAREDKLVVYNLLTPMYSPTQL